MKKIAKKIICLFISIIIAATSVCSVAATDVGFSYPDGVTAEQAATAVDSTDRLLNALMQSTGADFGSLITGNLYNDMTVSALLVNTYAGVSENGADLSYIGIDGSVKAVAEALVNYPDVAKTLSEYEQWSDVDLVKLKWGVNDKHSFAAAVGSCFAPFNDVLYTLLCSGELEMNRLITIEGANGYNDAIIPMLKGIGCKPQLSQEEFTSQAKEDKTTMVKNILLPVLDMLESLGDAPVSKATGLLPGIADFVVNGGFDECMNTLLSPITSNPLVEIASFLKIFELESMSPDIDKMLNDGLGQMTGENGIVMAPIELGDLAQCGSRNGDTFVSDKGKAYVVILRWLVETLKLNSDNMASLTEAFGMGGTDTEFLSGMLSKDTDVIVATIIGIFTPAQVGEAQKMVYPSVTKGTVQYTPNLTEKDYARALKKMDGLLDELVKAGGTANSMGEVVASMLFTNNNVNSLVLGIYGALEENGLVPMLSLLGIDATPSGVAKCLTSDSHRAAANKIKASGTWSKVSLNGVRWGFGDGSRSGFQQALTEVLRPLYPVLKLVLAQQDIVILDSITIKGSEGYNTAVIPILEGLGCSSYSIKSYNSYKRDLEGDGVIENVLDPVFDLVDEICREPVYKLTELLPNIVYFMNSGSLESCLNNLMLPVTALGEKLSGVVDMSIDASALTGEIKVDTLLTDMLSSSGMKIAKLDLNTISTLGSAKQRQSKSTINGEKTTYTYVEADQTAVFITLLRFLAETMKLPGNENLLMGAMGGGDSGGMASYGNSLSDTFADMTTDELIEWLYNLFFKERVKAQIVVKEDYMPTIIFEEPEPDYTWVYCVGAYLAVSLVAGIIIFINRKRLYS